MFCFQRRAVLGGEICVAVQQGRPPPAPTYLSLFFFPAFAFPPGHPTTEIFVLCFRLAPFWAVKIVGILKSTGTLRWTVREAPLTRLRSVAVLVQRLALAARAE